LYLINVLLITVLINYLYDTMNKNDTEGLHRFRNVPEEIQICNFGSSHGFFGFDYEEVEGFECFNFALMGQGFNYDRRIFEYYKDNIAKGAVVFIPVSYFSFYGSGEGNIGFAEERNARYYSFLPPRLIQNYDLKTDLCVKFSSLTAKEDLIRVLSGRSRNLGDDTWNTITTEILVNERIEDEAIGHIITEKFDDDGNRVVNYDCLDDVRYIITSLQEKGCIPILITTPFTKEYTDEVTRLDPAFYNSFYSLINEIIKETGIEYYDFAFDERFWGKYEYFMDSNHLNRDGAKYFMQILMIEVVEPILAEGSAA